MLGGGLTAAYQFNLAPGFFKLIPGLNEKYKEKGTTVTDEDKATAYKAELTESQTEVATLVTAGDAKSVKKADEIAESQVAAANQSGNDDYIVYASLTKANLLIDTNRAQEAIDSILLPLLEKYGSNEKYKSDIYSTLSVAYSRLGNTEKSEEYLNQVSGRGGQ